MIAAALSVSRPAIIAATASASVASRRSRVCAAWSSVSCPTRTTCCSAVNVTSVSAGTGVGARVAAGAAAAGTAVAVGAATAGGKNTGAGVGVGVMVGVAVGASSAFAVVHAVSEAVARAAAGSVNEGIIKSTRSVALPVVKLRELTRAEPIRT